MSLHSQRLLVLHTTQEHRALEGERRRRIPIKPVRISVGIRVLLCAYVGRRDI